MARRFLVDIVHPAHFHFYRNIISEVTARGDDVLVATRDKDVTTDLVTSAGVDAVQVSSISGNGRLDQARELLTRDLALTKLVRKFQPDIVLTRNPSGIHASLTRRSTIGVFDTDDGVAAGLHYHLARPAHIITMPDGVASGSHPRVRRYNSFKALAYLHPNRFAPRDVRSDLCREREPLFVVRTVAMAAAHDHGESGIPVALLRDIVDRLASHGRLIISSEGELPKEFEEFRNPLPVTDFHALLASADLVVGDSQTVATEAALLGTPVVHISTWSRRLDVLIELEDRWGLLESFVPGSVLITDSIERLSSDGTKKDWRRRTADMFEHKVDLTDWYLELLDSL